MTYVKRLEDGNWTEVTIRIRQYSDIETIAEWLRKNCLHEYHWLYVPGTAVRRCRFADPDDAMLFSLKWT